MGRFNPFPFIGGSYTDDALSWAHQDTVNYLPVRAEREGVRSPSKLAMVPGMQVHGVYGTSPHRGGRDVEGQRYVVAGTTLYKLKADGTGSSVGTIPGTGRVRMTHNQITGGNQLFIATGSSGYVYNTYTGVLTQVTDDAFPGAKSCDFLGQYVIGVEPFGRYWFHSALVDATDYNSLNVFQAETSPDRIVGLIASHNEVLIFGERTIEPWSNSPTENSAFQLQVGSVVETGCASGDTICRLDNSVFFLTDKGQVAKLEGYTPRIISTYAMEGAIRDCDLSRAFAFTWEDKGHTVYYITFPDGKTWGYDVRQGEWHRRESYGLDRWRLNTLFKSNGLWYGGDYQNGTVYRLDWDYALDGCAQIERYRTGPFVHDSGERVTVNALQVGMNCGGVESVCDSGGLTPVAIGPMLAIGQVTSGGARFVTSSQTGNTWSTAVEGVGADFASRLFAGDSSRFIGVSGGSDSARYSDDLGLNWTLVTLPNQAHNYGLAVSYPGVIVVAGNGRMSRSTTNGATWSSAGPAVNTVTIAGTSTLMVALTSTTQPLYSTNGGVAWIGPAAGRLDTVLTPPLSFQYCAAAGDGLVVFGGSDGFPVVAYTSNGIAFTSVQLAAVARNVTGLRYGQIGSRKIWLAGCSDGTLYRSEDGCATWTLCAGSLGVSVDDILFNGVQFIVGGGQTGTTAIKTSTDADIFTTRTQGITDNIESLAQGRT